MQFLISRVTLHGMIQIDQNLQPWGLSLLSIVFALFWQPKLAARLLLRLLSSPCWTSLMNLRSLLWNLGTSPRQVLADSEAVTVYAHSAVSHLLAPPSVHCCCHSPPTPVNLWPNSASSPTTSLVLARLTSWRHSLTFIGSLGSHPHHQWLSLHVPPPPSLVFWLVSSPVSPYLVFVP